MAARTESKDLRLLARSLIPFVTDLVRAGDRSAAARSLAHRLGADDCVICVRDAEINQMLPARGFPQTLPNRREWQQFLDACLRGGQSVGCLTSPYDGGLRTAHGVGVPPDIVCVLLSAAEDTSHPRILQPTDGEELRILLPLVSATLSTERALDTAQVRVAQSDRIAEEHRLLAEVLDDARHTLHTALAEAQEQRTLVLVQAAELEAMLQALPDALVVYDSEGVVTRANAPAQLLYQQVLGVPPAEMADCDLVKVLWHARTEARSTLSTEAGASEEGASIEQALRGQVAALHLVLPGMTKQDPARHFMVHTAPIITATGVGTGAVAVTTDISMLYALESHKEEFLSIVSHELRTPLTTLRMLSQMLERQMGNTSTSTMSAAQIQQMQVRRMIPRMANAVRRMDRLVADLFDTSRIQAGKLEMQMVRCDLIEVCQQAVEEQTSLTQHPIVLTAVPESSRAWVLGDPDRLTQVVTNLVSNAIKYSPADVPVKVHVQADQRHVKVSVQDAGPGIAADRQTQVFDRFFRIADTPVQQGSSVGLGLGLFIAKTIVESHSGTIGVESQPGTGATFWFTLPWEV